MKKIFQRIKDYFTANACRKIFFLGLLVALIFYLLAFTTRVWAISYLAAMSVLVAVGASMLDSMLTRREFLIKVRDMQYAHMQDLINRQEAGETVVMTSTFSDQEKKYLRRKRWSFIGSIILKLMCVILLFSLLLPK